MAAFTQAQAEGIVSEYTRKILHDQVRKENPLTNGKILKKKERKGEGSVLAKFGRLSSVGFIADNGALPDGDSRSRKKLTYEPSAIFGRVSIGEMIFQNTKDPKDAVDHVLDELKDAVSDMDSFLSRIIVRKSFGSPVAGVSAGTAVIELVDWHYITEGMTLAILNGGALLETVEVLSVVEAANGNGTVTMTTNFVNAITTSHTVSVLNGQTAGGGDGFFGIDDVCSQAGSGTGIVYQDIFSTHPSWSGYSEDTTIATLTSSVVKSLRNKIRVKGRARHVLLVNPEQHTQLMEDHAARARFVDSGKRDDYEAEVRVDGVKVHEVQDLPRKHAYLVDPANVEIQCFWDIMPRTETGKDGRKAMLVNRSNYRRDFELHGGFNLRVTRRNTSGRFTDLAV